MKVLFFNTELSDTLNGGYVGVQRNLIMANTIFGEENVVDCRLYLPSKLQVFSNFLFNRSFYYSKVNNKIIQETLKKGPYDIIFLNSSLFYKFINVFTTKDCIIYYYTHNVDYEYYLSKYRLSHSLKDLIMIFYVKRMEKYSVHKAHLISALNKRDSDGLLRWYGRKADFILPIGMPEFKVDNRKSYSIPNIDFKYGLFVGSSFAANVSGIRWFNKNVAPKTSDIKYLIIGSCADALKEDKLSPNIILIGKVEDLEPYYVNASFVICPIFDGSGMKTKTIEALRFGKTIIGTHEAFEGIDIDYDKVGVCSDKAQTQINKIRSLDLAEHLNKYSFNDFKEKYTYEAVFNKFKKEIFKYINNQRNDSKK